jgi:hypothetical protein
MHGGVSGIDEWRILQYNKSGVVTAKTLGGVSGGRTSPALQEWVH